MAFDIETPATINLFFQTLFIILISFASFLAKKRNLRKHCSIVQITVIFQIIAIAVFMLPSFLGYIKIQNPGNLFYIELLIHNTLGIVLIGLWIYINLVYYKFTRRPADFASLMKSAYIFWLLNYIIGLSIYLRIYL